MKCSVCETEFEAKRADAKYCSNSCKLKASRDTRKGSVTPINPKSDTDNPLSDTDKLFEESYPGYYRFSDKTQDRICGVCSKQFKTRLPLLKYCSPNCRGDAINANNHVGQKWRSISNHQQGGYWVTPGICDKGECLNPDCSKATKKAVRI